MLAALFPSNLQRQGECARILDTKGYESMEDLLDVLRIPDGARLLAENLEKAGLKEAHAGKIVGSFYRQ